MSPKSSDAIVARGRRQALGLAGLVFAIAAPLLYELERLYQYLRHDGGDPTLILRALHTAYYFRAGSAAWGAGLLALVVYIALRDRGGRELPRLAMPAFAFGVVAIAALCFLVP